ITNPKAIVEDIIKSLKSLNPLKGVTEKLQLPIFRTLAGLAPTAAYTLCWAILDLEFLKRAIKSMPRAEFGARLFVDVSYEECISHITGDNTLEKKDVNIEFEPIDPASDDALTASTFLLDYLTPFFEFYPLQTVVDNLEKVIQNPDELKKA